MTSHKAHSRRRVASKRIRQFVKAALCMWRHGRLTKSELEAILKDRRAK